MKISVLLKEKFQVCSPCLNRSSTQFPSFSTSLQSTSLVPVPTRDPALASRWRTHSSRTNRVILTSASTNRTRRAFRPGTEARPPRAASRGRAMGVHAARNARACTTSRMHHCEAKGNQGNLECVFGAPAPSSPRRRILRKLYPSILPMQANGKHKHTRARMHANTTCTTTTPLPPPPHCAK